MKAGSSSRLVQWREWLELACDRLRFRGHRADYYDYLSALLSGMQGRRTLHDVFLHDATRYAGTPRGRLSRHWARSYAAAGGDLYATWLDSFPITELAVIRVAQLSGNDPLVRTLDDLADALRLIGKTRRILAETLWSSIVALVMVWALVLAVPLFTAPRLRDVFSMLPPALYGGYTRALFDFASTVQSFWWPAGLLLVAMLSALLWSLPNLTGAVRRWLDSYSVWRIYRYLYTLRFLAVLTVVLARDDVTSTRLRAALAVQRVGTSSWHGAHIDAMIDRIDAGLVGPHTFDTGLLDRDLYWFFADMTQARGVIQGLVLLRERLKDKVLINVARQAQALRWGLLLSCVAALLALGLWHYVVIDELRRSLMLFYASQ